MTAKYLGLALCAKSADVGLFSAEQLSLKKVFQVFYIVS